MDINTKPENKDNEIEIIINIINKPSESAIFNLNKEYQKILREREKNKNK